MTMRNGLLTMAAGLMIGDPASAETFRSPGFYTIDAAGWQHAASPRGEVFSCVDCGSKVQVQIEYGAVLPDDSEYKTNKEFLAKLKDETSQQAFADLLLKAEIPEEAGLEYQVDKVGLTQIGGSDAFEYSALIATTEATRENAIVSIQKNRIMKITLNYFEDKFNDKAKARIAALFKSLKIAG